MSEQCVTASCCPTPGSPGTRLTILGSPIGQCDPRGLAASPATYLDSSIAYGEKLGWDVSFPECCWALLLQNLSPSLQDPVVFRVGVTARKALNLKLGIKMRMVRMMAEGRGGISETVTKATKCFSLTKLQALGTALAKKSELVLWPVTQKKGKRVPGNGS